jgi:hypothetical protein
MCLFFICCYLSQGLFYSLKLSGKLRESIAFSNESKVANTGGDTAGGRGAHNNHDDGEMIAMRAVITRVRNETLILLGVGILCISLTAIYLHLSVSILSTC